MLFVALSCCPFVVLTMAVEISLAEFNSNCSLFACVSADGHLKVWDVLTGSVRAQKPADLADPISCLAFCPLLDDVSVCCSVSIYPCVSLSGSGVQRIGYAFSTAFTLAMLAPHSR